MKPSAEEERLQWSSTLVADIYQDLSAGRDPHPRLERERGMLWQDKARQDFFARVCRALEPEGAAR